MPIKRSIGPTHGTQDYARTLIPPVAEAVAYQVVSDAMVPVTGTVAALPASPPLGTRSFVTDATLGLTAGIGTTVAGGGSAKVPVIYDGTNWLIG